MWREMRVGMRMGGRRGPVCLFGFASVYKGHLYLFVLLPPGINIAFFCSVVSVLLC